MKKFILLAVASLTIALPGCGGGGSSSSSGDPFGSPPSSSSDPVLAWNTSYKYAVENRRIGLLGDLIANNYLADCTTKSQSLQDWQDVFGLTRSIRFLSYQIVEEIYKDGYWGFAVKGVFQVQYPNGQYENFSFEAIEVIGVVNGRWRAIGNQYCGRSKDKTPLVNVVREKLNARGMGSP